MPRQPHVGVSIQGSRGYPNVDLPPMSSRRVSILKLAHRSEGTCEIWTTIKLVCAPRGETTHDEDEWIPDMRSLNSID